MSAMEKFSRTAWEPITPRGVATFARASFGRLLLVQFIIAVIAATVVVLFLANCWFPTVRAALSKLPESGEIRDARLNWTGQSPQRLAENTFLAFTVDLDHNGQARSASHVEVEFARQKIFIHSLLGYMEANYPDGWIIAFNTRELMPWFGAWRPWFLLLSGVGVIVGLLISWFVLATLYAGPVWLLMFYANRELNLRECWKLGGAALMPGALMISAGILLYSFAAVDLVGLGFIFVGHFVLGWIYLFITPLFLPRVKEAKVAKSNPFVKRET